MVKALLKDFLGIKKGRLHFSANILLLSGCFGFVVFMLIGLNLDDRLGTIWENMGYIKCHLIAGIFCLPGFIALGISSLINAKKEENAAN